MAYKQINNWKIKQKLIDEGKVDSLLLNSLNGNIGIYANVNQAIGAVCEVTSERHMQTLFEAYASYGIWLAKNNLIDINFKVKKGEKVESPSYC